MSLYDWVYESAKSQKQKVARSILLVYAALMACFLLFVFVVTLPYSLFPVLTFAVIATVLWAVVHA